MPGRQLRFNPLAEAELFEAARWYDERSTGLGAAFVDAVHDATVMVLKPLSDGASCAGRADI